MQIEDQFVKKKNIIQRKIEYQQEISMILFLSEKNQFGQGEEVRYPFI